ncbi:RNA polymerase sigma factor [Bacillus timonensis]|nr:RNA polymerase sigma factor [Bacillus timonensis]
MNATIDFSEIYDVAYKRLFHIAYSITRNVHLAEDVVQDAFLKAMQKATTIQDRSKTIAWLSVITTRTAIDTLRKEKRKIPMEQNMLEALGKEMKQNVEQEVETGLFVDDIKSAIKQLTKEYQHVLLLKLKLGLKENEIADVLNLNPCTVKTRIHRARKQLKMLCQRQISA